jgi:hypothetical protein
MALRNFMVTDWDKNTLVILESHQFYTSYCKGLLQAGKQKNMAKIKKRMEQGNQENASRTVLPVEDSKDKKKEEKSGQSGFITKGYKPCCALPPKIICAGAKWRITRLISDQRECHYHLSNSDRPYPEDRSDRHLAIPTLIFLATALTTIAFLSLLQDPR